MPENNDTKWHLDKRVSVGHLVTTITVVFAVLAWSFQIQAKIDKNDLRISQNERSIVELRQSSASQYAEIIRRLERIDAKSDAHLEQHANGLRQ